MARSLLVLLALLLVAFACGTCGKAGGSDVAGPENTVKVVLAGTGHGHVRCTYGTIDCPEACGPYDWSPGATAPLVATADSTSVFAGWAGSGCTISNDTCYVHVAGHMVVTATFTLKP